MPSYTLTDVTRDVWTDAFSLEPGDLGRSAEPSWSVRKRTLRGGRRDGVDLIEVCNGDLAFSVIPTRGMGLWKGRYRDGDLGWQSPVADGPVHPAFVNLMNWGGLGWLEGFDELMVRCGLEHNGAPYSVKSAGADGSERHTLYPLHGKIANIPAHRVAVHVDDAPPHAITVEGHVDEAKLFGPQIRMATSITTVPGSNRLTVRDEFANLKDQPVDMQVLYHWNFGPPHLEEGARFVAPARVVVPRNARAAEDLGRYDLYGPPEPGYAEQVYLFELHGQGPDGQTLAMLRNREGDRAVVLRFATAQLPCFTLWKNTGGLADGYVTGLEPATNYPNPKPYEKARRRVLTLPPGGRHVAEMTLEVLDSPAQVAGAEAEIRSLQQQAGTPRIDPKPGEPYAAE